MTQGTVEPGGLLIGLDDGIVVVMDPNQFDWDQFDAQIEEVARSMREVAERNARKVAESRAARARYDERAGGESLAREGSLPTGRARLHQRLDRFELTLIRFELTLARIEQDLNGVKQDVVQIRERMATKAEVESVRDDVRIVADGFAQTQATLVDVADLLKRYLTSA